jgi:hypothetical protein
VRIKFVATSPHVLEVRERPVPASTLIPDWWKKMPVHASISGKLELSPAPSVTAKRCFPLLDGITAGYIVTLWSDIFVSKDEDGLISVKWNVEEDVLQSWMPNQVSNYEIPEGYVNMVLKYLHGWVIETPQGYSCLITHPIGYPNLPIRTLTGVVDTDSLKTHANSPFVIKEGFLGIIPKGTPMFQVIPFKRDDWEMEIDSISSDEIFFRYERLRSTIVSYYGKFLRKKREYK